MQSKFILTSDNNLLIYKVPSLLQRPHSKNITKLYHKRKTEIQQRIQQLKLQLQEIHKTKNNADFLKKTQIRAYSSLQKIAKLNKKPEQPQTLQPKMVINQTRKANFFRIKSKQYKNGKEGQLGQQIGGQFKVGKVIGKGGYAVVKVCENKQSKEIFAIKIYEKYKLQDSQKKINLKRQISILQKINHPNIIKLIKTYDNGYQIQLILEYVHGHTLLQFTKNNKITQYNTKYIFKQIILALNYLHSNHIVHRDIKMENILITQTYFVKIIDFGFAVEQTESKKLSLSCGTPCKKLQLDYMAPEIVKKKEYFGYQTDMWSAGVLLYVLTTGEYPFKSRTSFQLKQKIIKQQPWFPQQMPQNLIQVIKGMINKNPVYRLKANDVVNSQWLNS